MKPALLLTLLALGVSGCVEYSTSTRTTTTRTSDGTPLGSSSETCRTVGTTVTGKSTTCG